MRKYGKKAAVVLLCLGLLGAMVLGASGEERTLTYGGSYGWAPLFIKASDGTITGVAVDVMEEIGTRTGITVEMTEDLPWKRLLSYVEEGKVDALAGIYYTDERNEIYLYTEPFMVNTARIFVRADDPMEVTALEDLKGKSCGKPQGGSFGDTFDTFAAEHLTVNEAPSKDNLYKMLLAERFDFVVMDGDDGTAYLKSQGLMDQVRMLDFPVNVVNVHIILSRNSEAPSMLEEINAALISMREEGVLQKILEEHLLQSSN